jgi:hypothetical protein
MELFVNSHKYSKFLSQHRILPYLFVKTLFDGHSIVQDLLNLALKMINYLFKC